MPDTCLVSFAGVERHGYILGSRMPRTGPAYTEYLDIGYNHVSTTWNDEISHVHKSSEEYFIVLQGQINMLVEDRCYPVQPGQLIGIRSGVAHRITGGVPPVENFLIRAPGGGQDKILMPDGNPNQPVYVPYQEPLLLDLHQRFTEYPLGGCLPKSHPNYSPLLDFTCVWGVDPVEEWANEQRHFHTVREEYYIVLKGRVAFEIDSSVVSVCAGEILGVKPPTVHRVIGGEGPVDILFVRVPGGRGIRPSYKHENRR